MIRNGLFLLAAVTFGAVTLSALAGLPAFGGYRGPYGDMVTATVADRCTSPQAVTAVTMDYRGFDTLGEEFILFTAVAGALLLLRRQQAEHIAQARDRAKDHRAAPPVNDAVHLTGLLLFPVTLVAGLSMVLHGHLTPGGGFQGGVLVASAFYFIYLAGEYRDLEAFLPDHLTDFVEAGGAGAFALLALFPLLLGSQLMANVLPGGHYGGLVSGGTIGLFNIAGGIEVAAAFVLLISSFLWQALIVRRGGRK